MCQQQIDSSRICNLTPGGLQGSRSLFRLEKSTSSKKGRVPLQFIPSGRAKGELYSINARHISPSLPVLVTLDSTWLLSLGGQAGSREAPFLISFYLAKTAHFKKLSRRDNSKTASLCAGMAAGAVLWCTHDACITSITPFPTEEDLELHMRAAHQQGQGHVEGADQYTFDFSWPMHLRGSTPPRPSSQPRMHPNRYARFTRDALDDTDEEHPHRNGHAVHSAGGADVGQTAVLGPKSTFLTRTQGQIRPSGCAPGPARDAQLLQAVQTGDVGGCRALLCVGGASPHVTSPSGVSLLHLSLDHEARVAAQIVTLLLEVSTALP